MVPQKLHHNHTKKQSSDFAQWQKSLSGRIENIISDASQHTNFLEVHGKNFLEIPQKISTILDKNDIENNFVYHLPHLAIYLYKNFKNTAQDLIITLFKLYQIQTGLKYIDIDWKDLKVLPEDFQKHAGKYRLDDRFILYMLGKTFVVKKYDKKTDEEKKEFLKLYKKKLKHMFLENGFFRKKVEGKISHISELKKTEFLRSLVHASFDHFGELKTISDRAWVEFIISQAKKEKKELSKKLKEKKQKLKTASSQKEQEELKNSIEKMTDDLEKIDDDLSLQQTSLEHFSSESFEIVESADIERYKKELKHKITIHDYFGVSHLENEIIYSILKKLSRFHIETSHNDKESALPKDFYSHQTFTCFSGAWVIASLLLKAGWDKNDIYIVNGFQEEKMYNHAFIVVRKHDGSYMRVDYGFDEARKIQPTKEMEKNIMFFLQLGYTNAGFQNNTKIKGIGEEGRLYQLTDGIMLMYLMNLSHSYIDNNELDSALELLKIVETIDNKNKDFHEAMGVIYYKKGEKEKAQYYFKRSCSILSHFYLSQYYYEKGEYKKAEGGLDFFINYGKTARGVDEKLLSYAVLLLKKIQEQTQNQEIKNEIGVGIHKQKDFLIDLYNSYIFREMEKYDAFKSQYIQMDEVDRKRILGMLSHHAKDFPHTQPAEIIMDLVKEERFAQSELYKKLNMGAFKLNI